MATETAMSALLGRYRVFIWDFDGTLFDTYPETVRAYCETLSAAGYRASPEIIEEKARVSFGVLHEYLSAEYGLDGDFFKLCGARRRELEPLYSKPFPGAREFCERVLLSGGENLLYTHRDESALELLRGVGMEKLFSDLVLATDGFPWKPAPDAINALIARRGAAKSECIMTGDREIDVLSGFNAGIDSCLLMPYDFSAGTVATYKSRGFDRA